MFQKNVTKTETHTYNREKASTPNAYIHVLSGDSTAQ